MRSKIWRWGTGQLRALSNHGSGKRQANYLVIRATPGSCGHQVITTIPLHVICDPDSVASLSPHNKHPLSSPPYTDSDASPRRSCVEDEGVPRLGTVQKLACLRIFWKPPRKDSPAQIPPCARVERFIGSRMPARISRPLHHRPCHAQTATYLKTSGHRSATVLFLP